MKIMLYALRPFDEQAYCEPYSKQYGIDYAYTAEVPTPDNLELAKGCDAVSTNPCLVAPEYLAAYVTYGGQIPAMVYDGKTVFGAQFHPEKSGETGLQILRNFGGLLK